MAGRSARSCGNWSRPYVSVAESEALLIFSIFTYTLTNIKISNCGRARGVKSGTKSMIILYGDPAVIP